MIESDFVNFIFDLIFLEFVKKIQNLNFIIKNYQNQITWKISEDFVSLGRMRFIWKIGMVPVWVSVFLKVCNIGVINSSSNGFSFDEKLVETLDSFSSIAPYSFSSFFSIFSPIGKFMVSGCFSILPSGFFE